ncbi:MAG: hypothetical protein HY966_00405 [Ignavibacteriales bacterium]|nr:hypothetical protein [Ignavibacteriales bacterium]
MAVTLNYPRELVGCTLQYDPYERFEGVTTKEHFLKLIKNDPAFSPFFLHNSKYATARIGGNLITSLHRKLGDMYEEMFKALLQDRLKVPEEDLTFNVKLNIDGELQERSTDGLIRFASLNQSKKNRLAELFKVGKQAGMGVGFEVRSCYQIGDSKRIQADRDMSLALKNSNIIPVMLIFCSTSLRSPVERLSRYWNLFQGEQAFSAVESITGFDLYEFLVGESKIIEPLMKEIFDMM